MIDMPVRKLGLAEPGDAELTRSIAVEAPVSIEVGGIGYAVMMATPGDLEDYALGFALGEGLVAAPDQVERIDVHPVEGGWALRLWVPPERKAIAIERARQRVSESSCGLCGIENIEEVLRPLPPLTARIETDRAAIAAALAALRDQQPLGQATGAETGDLFHLGAGRDAPAQAGQAIAEQRFDRSIVAVHNIDGSLALDREEFPRPATSLEAHWRSMTFDLNDYVYR